MQSSRHPHWWVWTQKLVQVSTSPSRFPPGPALGTPLSLCPHCRDCPPPLPATSGTRHWNQALPYLPSAQRYTLPVWVSLLWHCPPSTWEETSENGLGPPV